MGYYRKNRDFHEARWDEPFIMEMGNPGERGVLVPQASKKVRRLSGEASELVPKGLLRKKAPKLPELSQMQVLRHYMRLSQETIGTDINIDIDGDGIPDIDIDSDGDGIPDVNVDNDGDGKPDENIIEIKEWKPGKNVDGDLPYDTMDFNHLEDTDKPNDDHDNDGSDTSVKGAYNPVTSMGGANTGDNTNIFFIISTMFISLAGMLYMIFHIKNKRNLKDL